MTLSVGRQLLDAHGARYTVVGSRRETEWYVLCDAEKGFQNYRYRERRFYTAGPDEHLPVLLRCPRYPDDDLQTVDALRELLQFEATQVLSLPGARWFPEPIDLLPLTPLPERDVSSASPRTKQKRGSAHRAPSFKPREQPVADRRKVLAMVLPHGEPVHHGRGRTGQQGIAHRMRCAREALELLDLVHQRGLLLGCFDPRDLLVDPHGRLYYLGTDRIVRQSRMPRLRRFFPPERFFAPWCAPEALDAQGWLDVRSDFYSWAALTAWLLAPQPNPDSGGQLEPHADPAFDPRLMEPARVREVLTQLARTEPLLIGPGGRRAVAAAVDGWMECLSSSLERDPQRRPTSLDRLNARRSDFRAATGRRGWRGLLNE